MHYPNMPDADVRELVRVVTTYKNLSERQLQRYFYKLKPDIFHKLIDRLAREGRFYHDKFAHRIMYQKDSVPDPAIDAAFWVLLDFIADTNYHSVGESPASITFFYKREIYDICYVSQGKEILTNQLFAAAPAEGRSKKIVIIQDPAQISSFSSPDIHAFCLIDCDRTTKYFKRDTTKKGAKNGPKNVK